MTKSPLWEQEFDKEFTYGVLLSASSDLSAGKDIAFKKEYHPNTIKAFISKLLHDQQKEFREKLKKEVSLSEFPTEVSEHYEHRIKLLIDSIPHDEDKESVFGNIARTRNERLRDRDLKTCLSVHCPERNSICCSAKRVTVSEDEGTSYYACSSCHREFMGGKCESLPVPGNDEKGE